MIQMTNQPLTSGQRIQAARERLGLTQRALARKSGLSQSTLHRVEQGDRKPKMPELIALADSLGCTVSELSQHSPVRDRVVCFARSENGSEMCGLRSELVHFLELDAYLEEQGIA